VKEFDHIGKTPKIFPAPAAFADCHNPFLVAYYPLERGIDTLIQWLKIKDFTYLVPLKRIML
jgi:hypothetical protein